MAEGQFLWQGEQRVFWVSSLVASSSCPEAGALFHSYFKLVYFLYIVYYSQCDDDDNLEVVLAVLSGAYESDCNDYINIARNRNWNGLCQQHADGGDCRQRNAESGNSCGRRRQAEGRGGCGRCVRVCVCVVSVRVCV